jgi:hypothetical protein
MKKTLPACVWACIPAHMPSPRGREFYKELAEHIRSERMRQDQEREERAAEVRALEGRLHRLEHWELIMKQLERLLKWEAGGQR